MYARSAEETVHESDDTLLGQGTVLTSSEKAGLGIYGEVVYCLKIEVPNTRGRKFHYLAIYFPNEHHSDTGHGDGTLYYSEMARMFLKPEGSHKRWSSWFKDELLTNEHLQFIDDKIRYLYSAEVKQMRKEYMATRRSNTYRKILANRERRVARTQREIDRLVSAFNGMFGEFGTEISARTKSVPKMPRFSNFLPEDMTAIEQSSWRIKKEREFSEALSTMIPKLFNLSSKLYSHKTELALAKKSSTVAFLSPELRKRVERGAENIEAGRKLGLTRRRQAEYALQEEMARNPWLYGITIEQALNKIGKEATSLIKDALLGAKAPDIVEKTKRNRKARGNSDSPPLNETGEFANSLEFIVL